MKFQHVAMTIVLILAVGAGVYFVAEYQPGSSPNDYIKEVLEDGDVDDVEVEEIAEEEVVEEVARIVRDESNLEIVVGDGFILNVPESWVVEPASIDRLNAGSYLYGVVSSGEAEGVYGDPNVVTVIIEDVEAGGLTFEEVVAERGYALATPQDLVDSMRINANAPYNEITLDDISVSHEDVNLNGLTAVAHELICEKNCWLEGQPPVIRKYFVNGGELVYVVTVRTVWSEGAMELLDVGDAVAQTFQLVQ